MKNLMCSFVENFNIFIITVMLFMVVNFVTSGITETQAMVTPARDISWLNHLGWECPSKIWAIPSGDRLYKGQRKRKHVCLLTLALAGDFIHVHKNLLLQDCSVY